MTLIGIVDVLGRLVSGLAAPWPNRGGMNSERGYGDRLHGNSGAYGSSEIANASLKPLDFSHLRRYTLGDAGLEKEVLALFLAQLPVTIAALRSASTDRDWRRAAHTLKGSGRAVGAWPLAKVAEEAERLTELSDADCCSAHVARIERAADEVSRFISVAFEKP